MTVYSLYVPSGEVEIDRLCGELVRQKRLSEYLVELIKRDAKPVILANLERARESVAFWEGLLENGRDIEGVTDRVEHERNVALERLSELWALGGRDNFDEKANWEWLEGHRDLVGIIFDNKPVNTTDVINKIREVKKE